MILLFIISFVGLFVPIIPGVVMLWGGFILYHFALDSASLSALFWIAMALFTVLMFMADFVTNHYFVHKLGGSRRSQWGAVIGVIVGAFVYPPFGLIAVPFLVVFIIEILQHRSAKEAAYAALGALFGFLSGAIAKGFIQVVMIVWFIIDIWM